MLPHPDRQPDLLTIILHLISVYSRASNRHFTLHSQQQQRGGGSGGTSTGSTGGSAGAQTGLTDAQEICYSLMSAQESAKLQILLEHCLPDVQVLVISAHPCILLHVGK